MKINLDFVILIAIIGIIFCYYNPKISEFFGNYDNLDKSINDIYGFDVGNVFNNINNLMSSNLAKNNNLNIQGTSYIQQFRKNNYIYYPDESIIYQNIFDALNAGVFIKSGNPSGWNDTSYRSNLWFDRLIINIGSSKNSYPNGVKITVPQGKNVIWLRILNDRWECFQIYDTTGKDLGNFCSGYRSLNSFSPDGGSSDSYWQYHHWMAITVPGPGDYIICSGNNVNDGGTDCWISGLAFTTNPWSLAYNSALAYHWATNGGNGITWETENWNNDQLARIPTGTNLTLYVPIIPSGKDKLLYMIEHNNNWNGLMHNYVKVEDVLVDRFRTTWDNPLARSYNSKLYNRYVATRIPEILTKNKRFIKVNINMENTNHNIYIREIGTMDIN